MGWDKDSLTSKQRERVENAWSPETGVAKPSKYRNVRTEYNGKMYDSKREAAFAAELDLRQTAGEITGYLEQVPFRLPGGIVYRADFLIVGKNGELRLVDIKGVETDVFKLKAKLMQVSYPWLPLEVVK